MLLAVPDEAALGALCERAATAGVSHVRVHEPGLGDALTAAALEPAAYKLVSTLPLALRLPRSPREEVNIHDQR